MRVTRLLIFTACLTAPLTYGQTAQTRTQTLQRVAALIEQNDLVEAEADLQPLLKAQPDDAVAMNLLGLIRLRQHNVPAAADFFRKAIQTGHRIPGPHVNLAMTYGTGQPMEAISELGKALTIAPNDQQARSLLRDIAEKSAFTDLQAGDRDKAMAVLQYAQSVAPTDPGVNYQAGVVAFECGSYQLADRDLTKALRFQPDYPNALYALARTHLAENLAPQAEKEMREYLAERPSDATAEYGLGYVLMAEERVDAARVAFEKSLALQPDQIESVFQLGLIAAQQGQEEEAKRQFETVIARDSRHGGALTELGMLAYRAGQYKDAQIRLQKAIDSAPQYQKAHYYYALTLSRLGEKTEAEREFAVARRLQKEHAGEHQLAPQP